MLNKARKGFVAAKTGFVAVKNNTYLFLSEVSYAIEKAAFDSLSLHDDLKQEIPDNDVLAYLAGKASSSSALMADFRRQIGSGSLQERFNNLNNLLGAKKEKFERAMSQPFGFEQKPAVFLPVSEKVHELLPGIGEPLQIFQANPFERHLKTTL